MTRVGGGIEVIPESGNVNFNRRRPSHDWRIQLAEAFKCLENTGSKQSSRSLRNQKVETQEDKGRGMWLHPPTPCSDWGKLCYPARLPQKHPTSLSAILGKGSDWSTLHGDHLPQPRSDAYLLGSISYLNIGARKCNWNATGATGIFGEPYYPSLGTLVETARVQEGSSLGEIEPSQAEWKMSL